MTIFFIESSLEVFQYFWRVWSKVELRSPESTISWISTKKNPKKIRFQFYQWVVHKWRHTILEYHFYPITHHCAFYYYGLWTDVTKSLIPPRPWLNLWTDPIETIIKFNNLQKLFKFHFKFTFDVKFLIQNLMQCL